MSVKHEMIVRRLEEGEYVYIKESGNSMVPIIKHREPVTLAPVDTDKLQKGDIVFARVKGNYYTHLISATEGERVQISNNRGRVNGWVHKSKVYGIVIEVNGKARKKALSKVKT